MSQPEMQKVILVVDDDTAILQLVEMVLSGAGYEVWLAESGPAAIDRVERESRSPDLLLTDVKLPGMDGGALAREVTDRCPAVKVVYASGDMGKALSPDAPAGVRLAKPYSVMDVRKVVRGCLSA